MNKNITKTQFLTQFSILLAIEAIFCFTPLGSIPIGPIVATLAMIPVVIAGMILGIKAGAAMGAFAGLFSFIVWTFMPPNPATAFIFTPFYSFGAEGGPSGNGWSLVICFVPRILVGVVAGLICWAISNKAPQKDLLRFGLGGVCGSLVNTVLVMGGIALFFGDAYGNLMSAMVSPQQAEAFGSVVNAIILITVVTNGIPEAIISGLAGYAVCKAISKYRQRVN